jgi:hypothetical protein
LLYNHYIRNESLYNIRYSISGNTYHYTPDARYYKFVPTTQLRMRPDDYRKNQKEFITIRQVMVERRPSAYVLTNTQSQSYSVFNARYSYINSNISHHNNVNTDIQVASLFSRVSGEYQYRHLFNDNRQVNLRFLPEPLCTATPVMISLALAWTAPLITFSIITITAVAKPPGFLASSLLWPTVVLIHTR